MLDWSVGFQLSVCCRVIALFCTFPALSCTVPFAKPSEIIDLRTLAPEGPGWGVPLGFHPTRRCTAPSAAIAPWQRQVLRQPLLCNTCDSLSSHSAQSSEGRLGGDFVNRAIVAAIAALVLIASAYVLTRGTHSASADPVAPATSVTAAANPVTSPASAAGTSTNSVPNPPDSAAPQPSSAPNPVSAPAPPTLQIGAGIPDLDPKEALGSKSAPIVMEVFSDYQCPACKTLYITTNRLLMDNYVSTGKVYLIHRDFPLPMHAHSKVAAGYSRAASQIGKLEPVADALFQNQEKWEQSGDVDGTVASVLSSAEMTKVRALVKSGTLDAAIEKDKALGQTYRVNQTPTTVFHAKGQTFPYAGVMSWDILKQFLDQLLSQK